MKSGERETVERTELLNQEYIRTFGEKENFKSLGALKVNSIKQAEMKVTIWKEFLRRIRNLLETKCVLYSWNLIN